MIFHTIRRFFRKLSHFSWTKNSGRSMVCPLRSVLHVKLLFASYSCILISNDGNLAFVTFRSQWQYPGSQNRTRAPCVFWDVWQGKELWEKMAENEGFCRSGGEDTRDGHTVGDRAA